MKPHFLGSCLFLTMFASTVFAEPHDANKVVISVDGEVTQIEAKDLAEGETKVFSEDGKTIKITRKGDQLEVNVEGIEGLDGAEPGQKKEKKMVFITSDGEGNTEKKHEIHEEKVVIVKTGKNDAGKDGEKSEKKIVIVTTDDTGHGGKKVEIKDHDVFVWHDGEGKEGQHFKMPMFDPDYVTYTCAEGKVELRFHKDVAPKEAPACPVGGGNMEKAEAPTKKGFFFKMEK